MQINNHMNRWVDNEINGCVYGWAGISVRSSPPPSSRGDRQELVLNIDSNVLKFIDFKGVRDERFRYHRDWQWLRRRRHGVPPAGERRPGAGARAGAPLAGGGLSQCQPAGLAVG